METLKRGLLTGNLKASKDITKGPTKVRGAARQPGKAEGSSIYDGTLCVLKLPLDDETLVMCRI
jgi:hypothetical protein